jgi:hypothetical protein
VAGVGRVVVVGRRKRGRWWLSSLVVVVVVWWCGTCWGLVVVRSHGWCWGCWLFGMVDDGIQVVAWGQVGVTWLLRQCIFGIKMTFSPLWDEIASEGFPAKKILRT